MTSNPRRALGRLAAGVTLALAFVAAPASAQQRPSPATARLGFDPANLDRSVRPQDDFDDYVNGGWKARTQIPSDRSSWGTFSELSRRSRDAIKAIVDDVSRAPAAPGSDQQKIRDFYNSFMDTVRIEQTGITPLREPLALVAAIRSPADLPTALGRLRYMGVGRPLGTNVQQDPRNSGAYQVQLLQSGLGLPDREYYLRQDPSFAQIRSQYADFLAKLLTLAGQPDPEGSAQRVLALETRIAEKQWDRVKNRDPQATYNRMTIAELKPLMPGFDLPAFLRASGLGAAAEVNVQQPTYFAALDTILASTPISTWREYLTTRVLMAYAPELPKGFVQAQFDFFGRTLSGQPEMTPRWERGIQQVEGALGEALGKEYVARYFKPEAKARMQVLVQNLLTAFAQGIDQLDWMTPATKAKAREKLAHFTVKIGYPDRWRDYSALEVRPGDAVGNTMRALQFEFDRMAARLGTPVDRTEWEMTPQTVNAYYNPVNNEIVFPAAILQPPFFDVDADDAANYGGIVAVIGHEVSHGFDDQGRQFDAYGNLNDWWTPEDAQAFQARADRLAAEYGAYVPIDTMHINGRLTLGENIGDVSGLAMAYRAYRLSLGGKEAPVIDGFTGDQRFFIGWAQGWRSKTRDEALRQQLLTDPHSPDSYRAFVPLTNLDPFYAAFDVRPGDELYRAPEDRVKIW